MLERPPPKKPTGPSKAALRRVRDHRYRRRVAARLMVAEVEIDANGLDWLVRHRYIDPAALDGANGRTARKIVGAAIGVLIKISSRT